MALWNYCKLHTTWHGKITIKYASYGNVKLLTITYRMALWNYYKPHIAWHNEIVINCKPYRKVKLLQTSRHMVWWNYYKMPIVAQWNYYKLRTPWHSEITLNCAPHGNVKLLQTHASRHDAITINYTKPNTKKLQSTAHHLTRWNYYNCTSYGTVKLIWTEHLTAAEMLLSVFKKRK